MLGIIIVNYKTNQRLIKYINEELVKVQYPHKIVIVNNSCTTESNEEIAAGCGAVLVEDRDSIDKSAGIYLLGETENHGYARGNNIGARFMLKHFPETKYFCFSNCDLVFQDNDVAERLIDKLEEDPKIGLIGPRIVGLDGKDQSPRVMKNVWQLHIIPKLFYPAFPPRVRMKINNFTIYNAYSGEYDYLNGSFLIVSVSYFSEVEMFDPNTFIYAEEPILALKMRNAGYKVYFYSEVSVLHEHGVSVKQNNFSDFSAKCSYESNRYYQKTYKKINHIELFLYDLSYWIYFNIWSRLFSFIKSYILRSS
ncbi:glycosyltransferase [Sedimentisphaera salicampi]|uniref:Rhamnosyltransferase n=1 Tax=Sedimentisphaera salicampi TaxID=1941349 RepID=A0A1W6LKK5_9BACT|nr:glycosyltransferase family 2 protein [Sedimentisphaera salicampi]ARN56295.1 rhamnosyltransferase [Sedimentisphaera salicampi]